MLCQVMGREALEFLLRAATRMDQFPQKFSKSADVREVWRVNEVSSPKTRVFLIRCGCHIT